jgi:hypothetical protein
MTERDGYGHGHHDEPGGGRRPSGRGAVAERRAGGGEDAADREEAAARAAVDDAFDSPDAAAAAAPPRSERERSGAFEPHPAPGAPPAAATSIFDVGRDEAATVDRDREQAAAADGEQAAAPAPQEAVATDRDEAATADRDEAAVAEAAAPAGLLGTLDADEIHNRFIDIQAGFVDEPRQAVQEAGRFLDELVRQVIDALQAQRSRFQQPVQAGSTEDLRLALRAYRQFVDRLVGLAG